MAETTYSLYGVNWQKFFSHFNENGRVSSQAECSMCTPRGLVQMQILTQWFWWGLGLCISNELPLMLKLPVAEMT